MATGTNQAMPYLVGNKVYGSGRSFPTSGPVDRLGYIERDAKARARQSVMLRRMKANAKANYMSSDMLRGM